MSCYIARVNKPRVSYAGANILVKDKIPCIPVYLAFTVRYLVYSKVFEATYQYHDLSKADNNIVVLAVLVLDIGINHVWSDLEGVQTATGASSLLRRYELWLIFFQVSGTRIVEVFDTKFHHPGRSVSKSRNIFHIYVFSVIQDQLVDFTC